MMMTIWKIIFFRENRTKNYQFFSGEDPSNKGFNINPNTLPNPHPNSHRHFFELVEKYDDDNLKN